jgi:4-carboxymuconolactone decarboxylase
MAETEAYAKGSAIRRELMGEAYVERMAQTVYTDDIMGKFGAYATEAVFGMLWSRPGLDLKTRTLICVISDTVMGRPDELKIHLRMALRQGWTEDELVEAIMHLAGYAGLPLVREGLLTARETFQEIRAEG